MTHADEILGDEEILATVYEALAKRHPKSRSRGRPVAPAEMVLRLLVLKHIRNCSYQVLEREVPRQFGLPRLHQDGRREDAGCQDHGPLGLGGGPEVIKQVQTRLIKIAQEWGVVSGRRNARGHHRGGNGDCLLLNEKVA
jgi:IS5 family transposase